MVSTSPLEELLKVKTHRLSAGRAGEKSTIRLGTLIEIKSSKEHRAPGRDSYVVDMKGIVDLHFFKHITRVVAVPPPAGQAPMGMMEGFESVQNIRFCPFHAES